MDDKYLSSAVKELKVVVLESVSRVYTYSTGQHIMVSQSFSFRMLQISGPVILRSA